MRILLVSGIFPPEIGGPATYIPRLGGALSKRHDVTVLALGAGRDQGYPFTLHRVPRGTSAWGRRWRTVCALRRLRRNADVVLVNGLYFETALALGGHVPLVAKVVGDTVWERARNVEATRLCLEDFQDKPGSCMWRVLHGLQGRCMARFQSVFTPSEYLRGIVAGWGVARERLSVIPNAVNFPELDRGSPEVDLVSVARLVPWKGLMELVDLAVEQDISLALVGEGPLRGELEAYLKQYPSCRVELRGAVAPERVPAEMRRGKVFVLNSSYEGLPHVVLEAQAAGVPVVATRAGGTPECIEDGVTGRLVKAGDRDELKQTLSSLLNDSEQRAALVQAALERLQRDFNFEQMVEQTEALLRRVVKA
jgi:glycosyltransferase involved in cell wall biosynthesis